MSHQPQSVVCRRCGRGCILTSTYLDFLAQRGMKVKVPMFVYDLFLEK